MDRSKRTSPHPFVVQPNRFRDLWCESAVCASSLVGVVLKGGMSRVATFTGMAAASVAAGALAATLVDRSAHWPDGAGAAGAAAGASVSRTHDGGRPSAL